MCNMEVDPCADQSSSPAPPSHEASSGTTVPDSPAQENERDQIIRSLKSASRRKSIIPFPSKPRPEIASSISAHTPKRRRDSNPLPKPSTKIAQRERSFSEPGSNSTPRLRKQG